MMNMRTKRAPDASHHRGIPNSPALQQRVAENIIRPVGLGCLGPTPERRRPAVTGQVQYDALRVRRSEEARVPSAPCRHPDLKIGEGTTVYKQLQNNSSTAEGVDGFVCMHKGFFYFLIFYYYFMIIFTYKNRRGWKGSSHTLKKNVKKNETREMVRRGILSHTVAFFLF